MNYLEDISLKKLITIIKTALKSKVSKSGDIMTGNLTIEKGSPYLTLKNTTASRNSRISNTQDGYACFYNETIEEPSKNRVALWIAPETEPTKLLRINHVVNGESNTYKILHEGTDEAKKLSYTNIAYGTCSTAAATAAKVITVSGNTNWTLTVGSIIAVKFANSNSASGVTLNVNNTGAYPIWYNAVEYPDASTSICGYANRVTTYMFNGTHWVWISNGVDANTTYSNQSLGNGYGTCSTAAATTAKVVTLSSYALVTHGTVSVKFTNAVPANATMNINSKGAKNIYHNGAKITAGVINAGDIATFVYDGTQYQLIAVDRTNINYTATIGTTWTGSAAPYTQSITVTGITANDNPIVDVTMSGTYATDQTRLADWGKIYRIVTSANKITVYATAKTTASLPIQLQVVR